MSRKEKDRLFANLPVCAAEFIKLVIKKMRYRRKVRADVQAELVSHFEDELRECKSDEEKEQKARQLIERFGDVKLLGVLLRRAKKRCRPLWRKVAVRSFQVLGIIVLYLLICFGRLIVGTPSVSVDYVAWLNELVSERRDEVLNAKPYFDKAVEFASKDKEEWPEVLKESKHHYRWYYWPGDISEEQRQAVAKVLQQNKESLEMLKKGVEKPYYWANYGEKRKLLEKADVGWSAMVRSREQRWYGSPFLTGRVQIEVVRFLGGYRRAARKLALQIGWKAYSGDVEGALDDFVVLQKLGVYLQGKGLLTEQLMATAIEGLAHERVFMVLEKVDVPADVLKNVQQELEKLYDERKEVISFEAEKAFFYDYIQRSFTDDGQGGGRMLKEGLPIAIGDWKSGLWRFFSFGYPGRREVMATIERFYEYAEQLKRKTPWDTRCEVGREKLDEIAKDCFFLKILAPAYARLAEMVWTLKTGRAALLTVLAVLRYEREKSGYPESLDELVSAGYLKELPMDPYSDKPLVYKKTGDSFILYSVGPNFKDDNGEPGRDRGEKPKLWGDEGDAVFWPIANN